MGRIRPESGKELPFWMKEQTKYNWNRGRTIIISRVILFSNERRAVC